MSVERVTMKLEDFEKYRLKNNTYKFPVTIAFKYHLKGKTFNTSLGGRFICWWTESRYYHCEMILGDKFWISADSDNDVYIRQFNPNLKDHYDYITPDYVTLTTSKMKKVIDLINEQNGKKYDMLGIFFSQFIRLGIHDRKTWFCSELVTKLLELFGFTETFNVKPQDMSPGDLFNLIWENYNSTSVWSWFPSSESFNAAKLSHRYQSGKAKEYTELNNPKSKE